MIDLDRINIESINWAAERIAEIHPFPAVPLSQLPTRQADEWISKLHGHMDAYLGIIGALRRPGRAWVDVQFTSGRWAGYWVDNCPAKAAVACAIWHHEPVTAAGIGLRDSTAAADAHQARLDSGDLLALLGDEW